MIKLNSIPYSITHKEAMRKGLKTITPNPHNAFKIFEDKVLNESKLYFPTREDFWNELKIMNTKFKTSKGYHNDTNNCFLRLAERLVNQKNYSFAGIIYSTLLKLNPNNPEIIEKCAQNSKKIADRQHDWIHGLARCYDLKNIYAYNPKKQDDYLKNLYDMKEYLTRICNNYEAATKNFRKIKRDPSSKLKYQFLLADTSMEIANSLQSSNPKASIKEIDTAINEYRKIKAQDDIILANMRRAKLSNYIK